jgi:hypothetical protein
MGANDAEAATGVPVPEAGSSASVVSDVIEQMWRPWDSLYVSGSRLSEW